MEPPGCGRGIVPTGREHGWRAAAGRNTRQVEPDSKPELTDAKHLGRDDRSNLETPVRVSRLTSIRHVLAPTDQPATQVEEVGLLFLAVVQPQVVHVWARVARAALPGGQLGRKTVRSPAPPLVKERHLWERDSALLIIVMVAIDGLWSLSRLLS